MRRGSGVEHISHERIEGWFRNVHTGHAIELGWRVWNGLMLEGLGGGVGTGDGEVDKTGEVDRDLEANAD